MTFIEPLQWPNLTGKAPRTRRALGLVPTGRDDWKPHAKSMPLGRLAGLVASMPSWVSLDHREGRAEPDAASGAGHSSSSHPPTCWLRRTTNWLHKHSNRCRRRTTTFLYTTNWRLLAGGQVVMNQPRHIVLRDTLNHLAHHRGQLTVYLRLLDQKVPAIYGPSADDQQFA